MKFPHEPWRHQLQAVRIVAKRLLKGIGYYALFFEQGTGKTFTAITIIRLIWRWKKKPVYTLVLCPQIVVTNWAREFRKYAPEGVYKTVQVLRGPPKKRLRQLQAEGKYIFIATNDEVNTKLWEQSTRHRRWEILIIDESHKYKTHNSKRTQNLMAASTAIPYTFLLSGTPILNSMTDIWSQFQIMSRHLFSDNFYAWRAQYMEDVNRDIPSDKVNWEDWQPKDYMLERLQNMIAQNSMRVLKKDVLDLPELVRQTVYVELTPPQKRAYKQMMKHFIAELESGEVVVAQIALSRILRLMQICSGLASIDKSDKYERLPTDKLKALEELLIDLAPENKIIVWANFIESYKDIEQLCDKLKLPWRTIRGGQNAKDRQKHIDDFQHDPKVRIMIASQAAGGTGVNLTAASIMIYYSKNFNLGDDLQSEARAHRGGSEIHESVTRIDIVTEGTVEEEVTAALHGKKELGQLLVDIKREYGTERMAA